MLSPDGAWLWNGREWVPNAPPLPQRSRREPTSWTRPLQLAVIGLILLGQLHLLLLLPFLTSYIRASIRRSIDMSLAAQPGPVENADQIRAFAEQWAVLTEVLTVVVAVALCILTVIGTLKRWTWFYWVFMVLAGLSVLGLPQQFLQVFGIGVSGGPGQPALVLPLPNALFGLFLGCAELALFIWMIVALRRFGPWACRTVPAADLPRAAG
jgi:hypothetical protein